MHARTTRHVLLAAAVALAAPACTAPQSPAPPAAVAPLGGPGRVIVAWCDRFAAPSATSADTKVHVVTAAAYSTADGSELVERSTALPDGASVEPLCGQPRSSAAAADRQLFDAGFDLVAGTLPGPGGTGTVATAFGLRDGRPVGGKAPEGRAPVFRAGTSVLWYESADHQVDSIDLARADAAPVAHGAAPGADFALADGDTWLVRPLDTTADQVVVSPDGAVAAGSGPVLWHRTDPAAPYSAQYVEPAVLGRASNGRASVPGSEQLEYCAPRLWTDPATLLCTGAQRLLLLGFAADHSRLETVTAVSTGSSLRVESAALAPDGRSLAFLLPARRGHELYRVDLAPGAQPVLVALVPGSTADPQTAGTPHLVGWQ
ncbi:hypothetical protein AB0K43_03865 [Kitasatospora sp. NPDC049258]|uniref:hypothetical protein n=1 Tax=Kitasatospora sp. NPDC049258 TaxID=3155394 RepID=UPI00342BA30D